MADNYAATADQMMKDARALHRAEAHRNACYLAGYVVECTLKALVQQTERPRKVHDLESLHKEVATLLLNPSTKLAKYGDPAQFAPTMIQQVKPSTVNNRNETRYYCHWDPDNRYDGTRWALPAMSESYMREAEKSHDVIVEMALDGLVTL